jgi:hypothetical protein
MPSETKRRPRIETSSFSAPFSAESLLNRRRPENCAFLHKVNEAQGTNSIASGKNMKTRITLVNPPYPAGSHQHPPFMPLGIGYLGAVLYKNHF